MELVVHGRNVEVTDWIQEYADKKAGKLERYLPQVNEARMELSQNASRSAADRYTAQITVWSNGQILRTEESTSDIFASIDASVDKMAGQIRRFKGRRYGGRRASAAAEAKNAAIEEEIEEEEAEEPETGRIVRRKEFVLQPMDEEEAMAQMELLGHDFYIYYDVDAKGVNVVYRRKDGNYGLLQPKLMN